MYSSHKKLSNLNGNIRQYTSAKTDYKYLITRSSAVAETAGVTIRSVIAVDRLTLTVTLKYDLC